jgi:hypothetical protein
MKLMLTLLACLVALATAAPALAGNGQSVTESVGAAQASSTNVNSAVSVAAPVAASAPVCVASACSTSQSSGPAGSGASTAGGGESQPAAQKVSESIGAVQLGSTNAGPAVAAAAPVGAFAPVCVASGCTAGQSAEQGGSGASTGSPDESQTAGPQAAQTPTVAQPAPTGAKPAHGRSHRPDRAHGAKAANGANPGVGNRSSSERPRNGVFAPVAGPHKGLSAAAADQSGERRRAALPNGCVFSGVSAKFNGKPAEAGFVPSGGHSVFFLLAVGCGLMGWLLRLSGWVTHETRRWMT